MKMFVKPSFFEVFLSIAIYPLLRLISWNLTTRCLAVTGGSSVEECGRLSQPTWLLVHYNIAIHLLVDLRWTNCWLSRLNVKNGCQSGCWFSSTFECDWHFCHIWWSYCRCLSMAPDFLRELYVILCYQTVNYLIKALLRETSTVHIKHQHGHVTTESPVLSRLYISLPEALTVWVWSFVALVSVCSW